MGDYNISPLLSHIDFMSATSYAWGRSDQGANLDSYRIYEFGREWSKMMTEFKSHQRTSISSLQGFYESFDWS